MAGSYRVISADSHLEISCDRWAAYIPSKYRDRAPRVIKLETGGDAWVVENRPLRIVGFHLWGKPFQECSPIGASYEGSPGAGSPEQRVREQDQDGVDAEVLFSGVGGPDFWRGIKNDAAYKAMFRAYNTWLAEEYCAVAPDRLIGIGLIPDTGLDDALAELEECAKLGLKGVALDAFPSGKDYPSAEDDRFWAAALDLNMPLTVHVAFGGAGASGRPAFKYSRDPGEVSGSTNFVGRLTTYAFRGAVTATQMVMSRMFDRFPKLQIYFAENQIGWIPNFLEQLDDRYGRHRYWAEDLFGFEPLLRPPSEYMREHISWGFMRNPFGVRARHEIGVDRIMWGSDFPHAETNWPNSRSILDEMFVEVPEDEMHLMLAGNAIEFFHLDDRTPATSANAVTLRANA